MCPPGFGTKVILSSQNEWFEVWRMDSREKDRARWTNERAVSITQADMVNIWFRVMIMTVEWEKMYIQYQGEKAAFFLGNQGRAVHVRHSTFEQNKLLIL